MRHFTFRLTIVSVIVLVAASVLVRFLIRVTEDSDAARAHKTDVSTYVSSWRRGRMDNHERVTIFPKRRQVSGAYGAGLDSVGKWRVLEPTAGF